MWTGGLCTKFGFGSLGLKETDFCYPDRVVQLGVPPVRIDLITSLTGVSWEEASASRIKSRSNSKFFSL